MNPRNVLFVCLAAASAAAAGETQVPQAVAQLEKQLAKAPDPVAVEFRLRAAQMLKQRYPALSHKLVEASLADLRGEKNWIIRVDAVSNLLKELAPGHGLKPERWSLKLDPPDPVIAKRIGSMRGLPTDADRARLVMEVTPQIRALPAGVSKLRLARGLAGVATEGDLGKPALTAVAVTLAEAMRGAFPEMVAGKQGWAFGGTYLELASLIRYEHVDVPESDAALDAAARLLELKELLLNEIGFTLTGLDGKTYTLPSLKGRIVLLNFWATWCPPCRKEMPDMEKLYRKYERKGLTVLAVSDEKRETVDGFLAKNRYSFPVLLDSDREVSTAFGVEGIPKSFIFDREGRLAALAIDMRTEAQFMDLLKRAGLE